MKSSFVLFLIISLVIVCTVTKSQAKIENSQLVSLWWAKLTTISVVAMSLSIYELSRMNIKKMKQKNASFLNSILTHIKLPAAIMLTGVSGILTLMCAKQLYDVFIKKDEDKINLHSINIRQIYGMFIISGTDK